MGIASEKLYRNTIMTYFIKQSDRNAHFPPFELSLAPIKIGA